MQSSVQTNISSLLKLPCLPSTVKIDRIGLKRIKNKPPNGFQANLKWVHVFVTDDEDKAIRLRIRRINRLAEKDISLYSAVLDTHQVDLNTEALGRVEEARVSGH